MAGFENSVMVAKNVNFDELGAKPHLGIINAAGLFPIGTGNSSPTPEILAGTITSPDLSVVVGYSSPNITLTAVGVSPTTFNADTGSATPTLNTIILAGAGGIVTSASGNTVTFTGSSSSIFAWSDQGSNFAAVAGNGYFVTANGVIATLPASPVNGDTIAFVYNGGPGNFTIQSTGAQTIRVGAGTSTTAGEATSSDSGDAIILVYRSTNLTWFAISSISSSWTLT